MGGKRVGADGKEDGINNIPRDAPTRVRVPQRVVVHVRIPVEALRLPRLRHNRIRLDEAGEDWVVVAGVVVVQLLNWEGANNPMNAAQFHPKSCSVTICHLLAETEDRVEKRSR